MEKVLLIIVVSLLFSCKEKNKELNVNLSKNLFIYFNENINKEDSTIHLDSVRIIRLDTLTQSRLLYKKIMSLYDNIDVNNNLLSSMEKENDSRLQLVKLSAGLDKTLYENYLDEAKQHLKEMKDLAKKISLLSKSADSLIIIEKTADTTKLLYYQVKCLIQYQRKDLSIKRDTIFAFLTPEKNIVRPEDMLQ